MKCPECGSQNFIGAKTCRSCGKDLRGGSAGPEQKELEVRAGRILQKVSATTKVEPRDVSQKLRRDYSTVHREQTARIIDGLCSLLTHVNKTPINIRSMMEEAGAIIQKQFSIREVALGLRGQDGVYRYEVILGHRPEAEMATRRIEYSESDFWDDKKYKSTNISKLTRLFLSEDNPYTDDERGSYSRPFLLEQKRSDLSESIEGDYLDVIIPGGSGEALGWIELSGTRGGKLPDAMAIRWIEVIATVLGSAIVCNDIRRVMARESARKPSP